MLLFKQTIGKKLDLNGMGPLKVTYDVFPTSKHSILGSGGEAPVGKSAGVPAGRHMANGQIRHLFLYKISNISTSARPLVHNHIYALMGGGWGSGW